MTKLMMKIAMRSDHDQFKHSTMVLRGGAVIAMAPNLGPRHSEVTAINKIWPNKRRGCTIVNVRIRRDGTSGNSKPCSNCMIYLKKHGIKKVTYTVPGGFVSERI